MNDLIVYFSYINKGNNYEVYKALKLGKKANEAEINEVKEKLEKEGVKTLTVFDENYPEGLKNLRYSPFVLYYKGNIDLLKTEMIAATGDISNELTTNNINRSCEVIKNKYVLITGNYRNLDQEVIKQYKEDKNNIIYVLACGINAIDIDLDEENELVISQYPPSCHYELKFFKERNVIIAALAKGLIIYSSKQKSGIINLASCFNDLGKEVYCYPGITYDDGNTSLIKAGANLMTHIGDIHYY